MAKQTKNTHAKKEAPINWSVTNARQWKDGGITFALNIEAAEGRELTIYGCRIAAGKKGDNFISFPSRKGTDGKYYSHAYLRLTQDEQDEIIDAVMDALDEEDE